MPRAVLTRRAARRGSYAVALLFAAWPNCSAQGTARGDDVLERLRSTVRPIEPSGNLLLQGDSEFLGVETSCRVQLAPDGSFVRRLLGRVGVEEGFDGERMWRVDHPGRLRHPVLEERELALLFTWVWSGYWLDPDCPILIETAAESGEEGAGSLTVRIEGGLRPASLELDETTGFPARLEVQGDVVKHALELSGWREIEGRMLPASVTQYNGEVPPTIMRFESASKSRDVVNTLRHEPESEERAVFDASVPAALETRSARTGHLLVHPLVDGEDLGWFVFDTGAAVSVLSHDVAEAAGMETFGRASVGGAGAQVHEVSLREGGALRLGPLTLPRVVHLEFDLDAIASGIGEEIAGVVGFDVLSQAITAIDMRTPRIVLHDPESFEAELAWRDLVLHGRHPHARARYQGEHEGLFRLDTGAGTTAVLVHSPAVERHDLLAGRNTYPVQLGGAGGLVPARIGALDSFELAGRLFEKPSTVFASPGSGALDDPYTEGTIGGGIFGEFLVYFDYPHERIAFEPRE